MGDSCNSSPQIKEFERKRAENNGDCLKILDRCASKAHRDCNHRKGGVIKGFTSELIREGLNKGTNDQYAVIKHQLMNGDWWIRCLRCGKTWTNPIRSKYKTNAEYEAAKDQYETAIDFETLNQSSSSVQLAQIATNGEWAVDTGN